MAFAPIVHDQWATSVIGCSAILAPSNAQRRPGAWSAEQLLQPSPIHTRFAWLVAQPGSFIT